MTIATLADLYDYYDCKHDFAALNRAIYNATACGASISIHGTISAFDPSVTTDLLRAAITTAQRAALDAEYTRTLSATQAVYKTLPNEERGRVAEYDAGFHGTSERATVGDYITWARSVVPGAFPADMTVDVRTIPVVYHCGYEGPIPETFTLAHFTIQSIVEGHDACVTSDAFCVPVTDADIAAWTDDMEAQVSAIHDDSDDDPEDDDNDGEVDTTMWGTSGDDREDAEIAADSGGEA